MYPELITRPDIKVFLPPIGGLTVYICMYTFRPSVSDPRVTADKHAFPVGNPEFVRDKSKELTLRVHDECRYLGSSGFLFQTHISLS